MQFRTLGSCVDKLAAMAWVDALKTTITQNTFELFGPKFAKYSGRISLSVTSHRAVPALQGSVLCAVKL